VFPLGRFVPVTTVGHRALGAIDAPMKTLSVINPNAAGIDLGREKLLVSIAGHEPSVLGTVPEEVYRMRDFLKHKGVRAVAMPATGV
jgi:hypothetical protein